MKIMVAWKISPGCYKAAVERFLGAGAPDPEGMKTIGRWHAPGSSYGWHVFEGTLAAAAELSATWGDLLEFQITPVMEDAEAPASMAKGIGK
ncbi:MAG: DUF3303 domain-containing protein [Acidobacteria bacterium]|nr:DUF3303 domain-containing protein [Acidobacteriota bacterium]